MKIHVLVVVLVAAGWSHQTWGDTKKFVYDCEAWPEGRPPKEVFVVDGAIGIKSKDGSKAIEIGADPLVDANALLGDSANGSASIEARVNASKAGRSYPRFGVGVHGQSGFRLVVFPAKKELQLTHGEEIIQTAPLEWTTDSWVRLKLDVKKGPDGKWSVTGKAWPATATEPAASQISREEATLKGQGKCSIWGTPYAGTPIYFDDIKIEVEG